MIIESESGRRTFPSWRVRSNLALLICVLSIASIARAEAEEVTKVRVGLASLRRASSVHAGVERIKAVLVECREKRVQLVCFPETYLPGLRGADEGLPPPDQRATENALEEIRKSCGENRVAAIVGLEWVTPRGLENRAYVLSAEGKVLGYQTKNQITPGGEAKHYVADGKRQMFEIGGVKVGIVICHEGWRYPETVRWAAVRGAQIIFQPQFTGSDEPSPTSTAKSPPWGESFYEKAMQCRAEENTVYFASVNRALRRQNSATSLIDPTGKLLDHIPRGEEKLLVADLDLTKATGLYAKRFQPQLYDERRHNDKK